MRSDIKPGFQGKRSFQQRKDRSSCGFGFWLGGKIILGYGHPARYQLRSHAGMVDHLRPEPVEFVICCQKLVMSEAGAFQLTLETIECLQISILLGHCALCAFRTVLRQRRYPRGVWRDADVDMTDKIRDRYRHFALQEKIIIDQKAQYN